jgi:hypothetical protein
MAEATSMIEVVKSMTDAIEVGKSIASMFGEGEPSMADLAAAFAEEVRDIFAVELAGEDIRLATASLTAARDFLSSDYKNAVDAGESNADLYDMFDHSNLAPRVNDLKQQASVMASWTGDPSVATVGGQVTVNQAATLYLAIQTLLCSMYKEMSRVAPTTQKSNAHLADSRDAARAALTTMQSVLLDILISRTRAVRADSWQRTTRTPPPDPRPITTHRAMAVDGWLQGSGDGTMRIDGDGPGPSDSDMATMGNLVSLYQNMLWQGTSEAEDALSSAVNNAGLSGNSNAAFINNDLPAVREFGQWASKVRVSLVALDCLARGGTANKQDGWRWCNGCGTFFYPPVAGSTQCPQYGAYHRTSGAAFSTNYLTSLDSTDTGSQGGWSWCSKCGALHLPPLSSGNPLGYGDRCPANPPFGPHVPQGDAPYYVLQGNSEDGDIQAGWRRCRNCSVLHFPGGPNRCTEGGAHVADEGMYRVQRFGHWSPPISGPVTF